MTKQTLARHALCLMVLPEFGRAADTREVITRALEPYGPVPKKGSMKYSFHDLTVQMQKNCWEDVKRSLTRQELASPQRLRSWIHGWCTDHSIRVVDQTTHPLNDSHSWDSGMHAFVSDTGIKCVFEVHQRTPLIQSWTVGGVWAGFLRPKESVTLDDHAIPDFSSCKEWGLHSKASIALAANADSLLSQQIKWPVPHTAGPVTCVVRSVKQRFQPYDILSKHVIPWGLFINDELITHHRFTTSKLSRSKPFKGINSWEVFTATLISLLGTTQANSRVTVIDLELLNNITH